MKTEAETGLMQPQAEELREPPEAARGKVVPESPQKNYSSVNTYVSDFWLPERRENKFLLFEVCGNCL